MTEPAAPARRPPLPMDALSMLAVAAVLRAVVLPVFTSRLDAAWSLFTSTFLGYAIPLLFYPAVARLDRKAAFPFSPPRPVVVAATAVAAVALWGMLAPAADAFVEWATARGFDLESERRAVVDRLGAAVEAGRIPAGLALVLLGPVAEELIFRGALLSSLGRIASPAVAILCTALLFGAFHGLLYLSLFTAVLGMHLGIVARWTRGTGAPILSHALHNAAVLGFLLGAGPEGRAPEWLASVSAAAYVGAMAVLWKRGEK